MTLTAPKTEKSINIQRGAMFDFRKSEKIETSSCFLLFDLPSVNNSAPNNVNPLDGLSYIIGEMKRSCGHNLYLNKISQEERVTYI